MTPEARKALAARALAVQNSPAIVVDIVTFVYLAQSEEQAERHVAYYEAKAAAHTARELRPYQREAVAAVRADGLASLSLPAGAGKSGGA